MSKMYDVIVIGAGPAGLSAALYAGRARLKTLVVEKKKEGGQIALTSEVENYPGCVEGESGPTLIDRMYNQAKHFGAEFVYDEIESVDLQGSIKQLNGKVFHIVQLAMDLSLKILIYMWLVVEIQQ